MGTEIVVYIHKGLLCGNEKEWNMAFCSNVDGTGECYAKCNKSYRERQIPYVFTHMWILRNLTEDHGEGNGKNEILLNNQKEWTLAICNNMDKTRVNHAKWNKSVRERQISYDFIHMWKLENKTDEHREREGKIK